MWTKVWEMGTVLTLATPLPQAQHPPEVGSLAAGKSGSLFQRGQLGKKGLNQEPSFLQAVGRGGCVA